MRRSVVAAASYLGPDGWGNDQTGLHPWPSSLEVSAHRGELEGIHWSMVSDTDPSRFARMDPMCRLGLMAVEILRVDWDSMPEERRAAVGVCLETCVGSIDTDVRFLQTTRPSLFAYTLPSTLIGEVCIRYRLKGPALCLMGVVDDQSAALAEATEWIRDGDAEAAVCVGCEAVDAAVAASAGLPAGVWPVGGRAGALWLTEAEGAHPALGPTSEPVIAMARRLVLGRNSLAAV
ncbi:MAG: hypothetical protein JNK85_15725 [Verrucomicrobiales bacterium]|nr:hypothetical protein [Verrucomicrobiales bacterium]